MRHSSLLPLALGLTISAAALAFAQEFKAGDILIEKPWERATPKGAEVGGAYMTILNKGATPDRLTGGSADFATVEVHETKSENGVMQMREVAGGLAIPAHGSVGLAPAGYHLMFTGLRQALQQGRLVKGTLQFEKAGSVEVEYRVEPIGARSGEGKPQHTH